MLHFVKKYGKILSRNDVGCFKIGIVNDADYSYSILDTEYVRKLVSKGEEIDGLRGVVEKDRSLTLEPSYFRTRYATVSNTGELENGGAYVLNSVQEGGKIVGYIVFDIEERIRFIGKEEAHAYFATYGIANGFLRQSSVVSYNNNFNPVTMESIKDRKKSEIPEVLKVFEEAGCEIVENSTGWEVNVPRKGIMLESLRIPVRKNKDDIGSLMVSGGEVNIRNLHVESNPIAVYMKNKGRVLNLILGEHNGKHENTRLKLSQLVDKVVIDPRISRIYGTIIEGKIGNITVKSNVVGIDQSFNMGDIKAVDMAEAAGELVIRNSFNHVKTGMETHLRLGGGRVIDKAFNRKSGVIIHGLISETLREVCGFKRVVKTDRLDLSRLSDLRDIKSAFIELDDTADIKLPENGENLCIEDSFSDTPKLKVLESPRNKEKRISATGNSFSGVDKFIGNGALLSIQSARLALITVKVKNYDGEGTLVNVAVERFKSNSKGVRVVVENGVRNLRYFSAREVMEEPKDKKIRDLYAKELVLPKDLEVLVPVDGHLSNMYYSDNEDLYDTNIKEIPDGMYRGSYMGGIKVVLPKNLEKIGDWALAAKRVSGVYIPQSVREIGTRAIASERIFLHRDSWVDKKYKNSAAKVYVEDKKEIYGEMADVVSADEKAVMRLTGVMRSEAAKELGLPENGGREDAEVLIKMYVESTSVEEPNEFKIKLNSDRFISKPLGELRQIGKFFMDIMEDEQSRSFKGTGFNGTSDRFNIMSNIITANTDGDRASDILAHWRWPDNIGERVREVMETSFMKGGSKYGLVNIYKDHKSAILAIPFLQTTVLNVLNDLVIVIIIDGEIKYCTMVKFNTYWSNYFRNWEVLPSNKGLGRFIQSGDSIYRFFSTVALKPTAYGLNKLGRMDSDSYFGGKGETFIVGREALDQNVIPISHNKVICLNTGRLMEVSSSKSRGKGKKDINGYVGEIKKSGDYSYEGLIPEVLSENKRALSILDEEGRADEAKFVVAERVPSPVVSIARAKYSEKEVARLMLEELPHKVMRIKKDELGSRISVKEVPGLVRLYDCFMRDSGEIYSSKISGRMEVYTTEEEINSGKKTVRAIEPGFSLQDTLELMKIRPSKQKEFMERRLSQTDGRTICELTHLVGVKIHENFKLKMFLVDGVYSLMTWGSVVQYHTSNDVVSRNVIEGIDIVKFVEYIETINGRNGRIPEIEEYKRNFQSMGRRSNSILMDTEEAKALYILHNMKKLDKYEWYILVKSYSGIFGFKAYFE